MKKIENYQNLEYYRTMNIENEKSKRARFVSKHLPIIPVVCGGGLASLTSSKATVDVVVSNNQSYTWKMECVEETHRETLKSSCATCATCATNESVTTSCVANETVTTMHRRNMNRFCHPHNTFALERNITIADQLIVQLF